MENNQKVFLKLNELFPCFIIAKKGQSDERKTKIIKKISNYNDIKEILKFENLEVIKYLYFNRKNIHNILYYEQESIEIECNKNNIKLPYIFYLYLLIEEDRNMINYLYSIDYIRNIYNDNINNNSKNKYKLIIISIIIIGLIGNYRNTDLYDEDQNEELTEFEKKSNEIINNREIIKNNNLIKIDNIYIDIIKSLIIEGKFEDYDSYNIINELELENIDITKTMFDEILKILNSNDYKKNINEYIILEEKDLYDEKKINFYFILLKYILKNSIYIYHIPILLKTRKFFIKLNNILYNNIKENIREKFEYIFEKIVDLQYYYNKKPLFNNNESKDKSTIEMSSINSNTSKIIKKVENYENNNNIQQNENNSKSIIEYSHFSNPVQSSQRSLGIASINNVDIKQEIELNNIEDEIKIINYIIKTNKTNQKEISLPFENTLDNSDDINNKYLKLKEKINEKYKESKSKEYDNMRKNLEQIDNFIKEIEKKLNELDMEIEIQLIFIKKNKEKLEEFENYSCSYKINSFGMNNEANNIPKDENILNNKEYKNFYNLLNKLDFSKSKLSIISINNTGSSTNNNIVRFILNSLEVASSNEIIRFLAIIGKHNKPANYIKELSNGIFVSGGDNNLFFYEYLTFKIRKEYKIKNINIYEKESEKKNEIQLIVCSNENSNLLTLTEDSIKMGKQKSIKNMRVYLKTQSNILICNEEGIFQLNDLFIKIIMPVDNKIINKSFWGGIQIYENLFAFTSNKVLLNGEDELIIFNSSSKKIINTFDNYSFCLYQNNLSLISKENESNNKILLCACKKYIKSQKNGILLVKIPINFINNITKAFYDTGKFEVYCFCQIFTFESIEINILNKNKICNIGTNFFLVGGFDPIKNQGLIKLYRINYNKENFDLTKIEYLQDIEIEKENKKQKDNSKKFKGFNSPITCITQSKYTGNILITCFDGNVYLFTFPNIEKINLKKLN